MSVQLLIQQAGPLPLTATFQALGDMPMYLEVNGSVWSQSTDAMIGIAVSLDGQEVGHARIWSNGPSTHRATVPAYIPIKLSEGQHTLTLSADTPETVSDYNDLYTAVIHY